jgi:hypothetical protein
VKKLLLLTILTISTQVFAMAPSGAQGPWTSQLVEALNNPIVKYFGIPFVAPTAIKTGCDVAKYSTLIAGGLSGLLLAREILLRKKIRKIRFLLYSTIAIGSAAAFAMSKSLSDAANTYPVKLAGFTGLAVGTAAHGTGLGIKLAGEGISVAAKPISEAVGNFASTILKKTGTGVRETFKAGTALAKGITTAANATGTAAQQIGGTITTGANSIVRVSGALADDLPTIAQQAGVVAVGGVFAAVKGLGNLAARGLRFAGQAVVDADAKLADKFGLQDDQEDDIPVSPW